MEHNICGWFEIPAPDMDRAIKFYEDVFQVKLTKFDMGELVMAWFPGKTEGQGATGALCRAGDWYKPSADGVLVYLSAPSGDLANELGRVEKAGGKVLLAKKQISTEHGYMGLMMDSEGNRVGLHSVK